jgi:hypothetical protein
VHSSVVSCVELGSGPDSGSAMLSVVGGCWGPAQGRRWGRLGSWRQCRWRCLCVRVGLAVDFEADPDVVVDEVGVNAGVGYGEGSHGVASAGVGAEANRSTKLKMSVPCSGE